MSRSRTGHEAVSDREAIEFLGGSVSRQQEECRHELQRAYNPWQSMTAVDTHRTRLGGIEGEEIRSGGQVLALGSRRQEEGRGSGCTRTLAAGISGFANPATIGASAIATDGRTAQKTSGSPSSPLPGSARCFDRAEKNLRKRSRRQAWTPQKGEDQEAGDGRVIIFGATAAIASRVLSTSTPTSVPTRRASK
jgi:hypothetical protein